MELRGDSLAVQEALYSSMLGRSHESAASEIEEEQLEGGELELEDLEGQDEDEDLDFEDDEPWNVHWPGFHASLCCGVFLRIAADVFPAFDSQPQPWMND